MSTVLTEVTRGELVESRHRGSVVVAHVDGEIVATAGDPETPAFFRSAAKPFQSVPLVESGAADAFGFGVAELAMACASHDATPDHQRVVTRMLTKIGLDDAALGCGFSPPLDPEEQARVTLGMVPR